MPELVKLPEIRRYHKIASGMDNKHYLFRDELPKKTVGEMRKTV